MLQRITLNLARSPEFPEGSAERGYDLVAPLDTFGHLDVEEWKTFRSLCRVRRFWSGENDRHGLLVHKAGGSNGATWKIDYAGQASDDEETGIRLDGHGYTASEYVSICDGEGHPHTFKITGIQPLTANQERPPTAKSRRAR